MSEQMLLCPACAAAYRDTHTTHTIALTKLGQKRRPCEVCGRYCFPDLYDVQKKEPRNE